MGPDQELKSQEGTSAVSSLLLTRVPNPGPDSERLLGTKRCTLMVVLHRASGSLIIC